MKKLTLLFVFVTGMFYFGGGCFPDLCDNKIEREIYSPNNLKKAVIFERDCGATTRSSTQVSILDGSEKLPNEGGNTFVSADILHFGPGHDLYWISDNKLVIEYNFSADIRFKVNNVNGVYIIYKDSRLIKTDRKSN